MRSFLESVTVVSSEAIVLFLSIRRGVIIIGLERKRKGNVMTNRIKPRISAEEYKEKLLRRKMDEYGKLIPDSTPLAPPIGFRNEPSMVEIIRDMVASERVRQDAENAGMETLEEADDFDVGDDAAELQSGYENELDPPMTEIIEAGRQALEEKERLKAENNPPAEPTEKAENSENDPLTEGPEV